MLELSARSLEGVHSIFDIFFSRSLLPDSLFYQHRGFHFKGK
jgi:hypothetical protein